MRISQAIQSTVLALLLTSCGHTSKSTVHSGREWHAHKNNNTPLPSVTLKLGERTLAYKNRLGFPPIWGGYIPSLLAENPTVVKAELISVRGGFDTYLTGLKPGITRISRANGIGSRATKREHLDPKAFLYTVRVEH
ncbi:hypothetical protein V2O64_09130 [Verrucomicrobiaceae bacterium 227]